MKRILFFLFFTLISVKTYSQVVTTKLVMDEISKSLTSTVNQAMDRADYTVAKSATEALSLLDAWKETNSHLMDKAFSGIDIESRNVISRIESLSKDLNTDFENHISNINEIVTKANQITENLPTSSRRSFILDYSPKVIFPTKNKTIRFSIKGVNLDKSNARYKLKNGNYVDLDITGPTTASLELPITELSFNENQPKTLKIEIEHETRDGSIIFFFPKFKDVKRSLIVSLLPSTFGEFELSGTRTFESDEKDIYETNAGRFEGTNTNVWKIAKPLEGFKWDLRNGIDSRNEFQVTSYGGEAARCENIVWNNSNEHGISIQARCDQIREVHFPRGVRWKSGHINCGVKGPIYRTVEKKEPIKVISEKAEWNIDKSIIVPSDLSSFQLIIKMYDGTERIITNDYSDGVLKVIKNKENIIIRTTPPKNL